MADVEKQLKGKMLVPVRAFDTAYVTPGDAEPVCQLLLCDAGSFAIKGNM